MKLYYSNTSPYSRKVRLVIIEKGLNENIEQIPCNPFSDPVDLHEANPLGKIPTLITDEGTALYDSPVICEYLDTLSSEPKLIPASGTLRWQVQKWQALTDGIIDLAYNIVMERRRPQNEQSPDNLKRWQTAIVRAIAQTEIDVNQLPDTLSIAQLGLGACLGYLDFRLPEIDWREGRGNLARWYENFSKRESMIDTRPE